MLSKVRVTLAIGIGIVSGVLLASTLVSEANASPSSSSRSSSSSSKSSATSTQCDADRDGALAANQACGGQDCNDSDADINPKRLEISISACQDGKDNDCNGAADCADRSCEGKPAFLPNSVSFKPTGMCCSNLAGGSAVDVSQDSANCGACGRQCNRDEMCVDGQCVSECTAAATTCFREPFAFSVPIQRTFDGKYPQPIQSILDRYLGDPDCPRPTTEPKFDLKYFSEPLLDGRGKPTGQTIRGLCVTAKF